MEVYMDSFWAGLIQQLITTAAGASFIGLSTILGFYIKRLTDNLKRKSLVAEIDNYVRWADQYPSFKKYDGEQKFNAVFARGMQWATENSISVSPEEMTILVESTVQKMNSGKTDPEIMEVKNIQISGEQDCSEETTTAESKEVEGMLLGSQAERDDSEKPILKTEKSDLLEESKNNKQIHIDEMEE
jgi:hypothetical protein